MTSNDIKFFFFKKKKNKKGNWGIENLPKMWVDATYLAVIEGEEESMPNPKRSAQTISIQHMQRTLSIYNRICWKGQDRTSPLHKLEIAFEVFYFKFSTALWKWLSLSPFLFLAFGKIPIGLKIIMLYLDCEVVDWRIFHFPWKYLAGKKEKR